MLNDVIAAIAHYVHTLPIWAFGCILLALSGFGLWSFFRMSRWFQHARMIENVPTAKIRSASQGYVELSGQAKLMKGPIIVSPLTSKTCVWYSYKIEERVNSTRGYVRSNSHWQVVEERRSEDLFLLEDDTGRCVIDPDDADVFVSHSHTWHKHHIMPPRRYTEQLIRDGDPLYAIGFFKTVATIEAQKTRQQVAQLLRQWKNDPNLLLHRFDHDRNSQLDPDEWDQARQRAERDVKREQGQREKEAPLNVMTSSEHADQMYILSSETETVLIRQYQWRAVKSLLVFFTTGTMAIWAFNIRFGF
jgi:hypothetical protein